MCYFIFIAHTFSGAGGGMLVVVVVKAVQLHPLKDTGFDGVFSCGYIKIPKPCQAVKRTPPISPTIAPCGPIEHLDQYKITILEFKHNRKKYTRSCCKIENRLFVFWPIWIPLLSNHLSMAERFY
jgi:hypothetical protein